MTRLPVIREQASTDIGDIPRRIRLRGSDSNCKALLGLPFQRFANREQKDSALAFRVWREELNHIVVEESQAGRTQSLGIRSQIHPAADGTRFQLDSPIAAVSVSVQDSFQTR